MAHRQARAGSATSNKDTERRGSGSAEKRLETERRGRREEEKRERKGRGDKEGSSTGSLGRIDAGVSGFGFRVYVEAPVALEG
jgi:hypothetical protein